MKASRFGAALLLTLAPLAFAEAPFDFESTPGQLPKDVIPVDYAFRVAPDVEARTFEGVATIQIRVLARTRQLVLNAHQLTIASARLVGNGDPRPLTPRLDPQRQLLTLPLETPLAPGDYVLELAYAGVINEATEGLWRGVYRTPRGDSPMLATQMEAVEARRMLPCWDEPAFRATFRMEADLPAHWTAYSNMPVEKVEPLPNGLRRTRFGRTPKMPSYLLVLVAGELERVTGKAEGVELGIVVAKGKRRAARYALAITGPLLRYFNDYFGVPYPLPKLDQFAVPPTAGFGAMENWGGILYDEQYLLLDERTSTDRRRRTIHDVVAHEIAHQWYGNLVTMAWWDNLWLNEGFASWMGAKATDALNPGWDVWQAEADGREAAMRLDARKTTHPIQQRVERDTQANDSFDAITYNKGQAFLRMLENWVGEGAFRDGMRAYMARHQYSNATTADLWTALERASGKPVREMAAGWTEQSGFPVLLVDARCENGSRRITLRQEQFKVDGRPGWRRWRVPVALVAGRPSSYLLLDRREMVVERPGCDGIVVVDPDAVGYFRVQYAPALQQALVEHWPGLLPATRLKLLHDSWALAGTGRIKLEAWLDLAQRTQQENDPWLWTTLIAHLAKLDQLARGEEVRPQLRRRAVAMLQPQLQRLGWQNRAGEPQAVRELRAKLIEALGHFGDPAVVAEARTRFARYLRQPASLPPALRDVVVGIVGQHADAATQARLIAQLRAASGSEEQSRFLGAIAGANDPALARQALELSLDPTLPASLAIDFALIVGYEHPELTWAFVREHHEALGRRLGAMSFNDWWGGTVKNAADERLADELEEWVDRNLPREARLMTHRAADAMRFDARLKARLLPQLQGMLENEEAGAASAGSRALSP